MFVGLHVKHRLFLPGYSQTSIISTDFEKYSSIKFH